jgi:hypothetical protein
MEIVTLGMTSPFDAVLDWQYSFYVWLTRAMFCSLLQRVVLAKQRRRSCSQMKARITNFSFNGVLKNKKKTAK